MNSIFSAFLPILLILTLWFAWQYFNLRKKIDLYSQSLMGQKNPPKKLGDLENISSAINSLQSTFNTERSVLHADYARVATALEQLTIGELF